jgi:raffinose/stachyose/melibiose transport system permease protein
MSSSSMVGARRRALVLFAGPALAVYLVFVIVPVGYAVWLSLHETVGYGEQTWVGLRNYLRLATDDAFLTALKNTGVLLVVVGGLVARNILFFPNIINAIVFGIMAGFLFNPDGLVNSALKVLGIADPPKWLSVDNTFTLIMATMVWSATGYYTTILMAGVDRIPAYFYEDCALAGANAWQRLRYVTIPLSWDVFTVCALLWTISSVKIFELIIVFGGNNSGLPPVQTWPVAVYSYAEAFGGQGGVPRYGMAAASALTSLLLVTLIVAPLRRILRRRESVEF